MEIYNIPEIARNVFWVGVKDWNRRMFDALIPLPQGTSYNAYLVKGEEKTALIDTVNPGFEKEFEEKINMVSRSGKAGLPDYEPCRTRSCQCNSLYYGYGS